MEPLNILYFISSLQSGGAERHLLELCRYVISRGHRATVCTLSGGGDSLAPEFLEAGAILMPLSLGSLGRLLLPGVRSTIRSIVDSTSPDLVHAHLYHAEIAACVAASFTGAPLVVTRHSAGLEFEGVRSLLSALAARRVDGVIAVSQGAAEEAVDKGADAGVVEVIPNGVDTARFVPIAPDARAAGRRALSERFFGGAGEDGILIVGTLGGLKKVKDPGFLLDRVAALAAEGDSKKPPRVVFIGDGPLRGKLESSASRHAAGLAGFTGHVDSPEEFLPLLDIFALTSLSEGVPLALLEAMACGLPCIASEVGGVPEVLEGCGLLYAPGDPRGLLARLRDYASDRGLREESGRLARERAVDRYGLEAWGGRTLAFYSRLLSA